MCGIVGIAGKNPVSSSKIEMMLDLLKHRGPDDRGVHVEGNVGIGNVRLSIIDPSPEGHMPMRSSCRDIWITYNGAIYNYIELREELIKKGHAFKSKSDTEVILHAYEEWGEKCLDRFNGMFAFMILDGKKLFCARDRFGVKPFYYYSKDGFFIAASEIKAILANEGVPRKPSDQMIFDYLLLGITDHTEHTFFEGIKNLEPGHCMTVEDGRLNIKKWWELAPERSKEEHASAVTELKKILEDSVKLRLRSDVPVGACLSGGIDSSSIVSIMRKIVSTHQDIQGFSAVFPGHEKINEEEFIELICTEKSIRTHIVAPGPEDLARELEKFIRDQDEPVRSSSQFAHWMVMQLAHEKGVRVLLDGQGADEIFAGYRYFFANHILDLVKKGRVIKTIREIRAYRKISGESDVLKYLIFYILPKKLQYRALLRKIPLDKRFVRGVRKASSEAEKVYLGGSLSASQSAHVNIKVRELLRYEDRNAMAFSIETRFPFLDHRMVSFTCGLPDEFKISDGVTKRILREAVRGIVPESIVDRHDKIGFATPEAEWLKDEKMRRFVTDILSSEAFRKRGYFDVERLREIWTRLDGTDESATRSIWRAVCLETWFREVMERYSS